VNIEYNPYPLHLKVMLKLRVIPDIEDSWTVEEIANKTCPSSWQSVFEYAKPELKQISEIIERESKTYRLCPSRKDTFRAFQLTPFDNVKVVILGQDPYPQVLTNGIPRATGLSFSVRKTDSIPSSLINIYRELADNYPDVTIPRHGCLESWARQGVLFLNTALTVREGKPGAHVNVWMPFTRKIIRRIVEEKKDVIFVLWGMHAQKMQRVIGDTTFCLTAAHPSGRNKDGFLGCRHFIEINEFLEKKGYEPIDWQIPL
jgi:uracil-DNA glycosylase